jgi:N6-adenosine-specific RNA methylase IME4
MKYDVIIADPPWKYTAGGRGAAKNHYDCMSDQEILNLGPLIEKVSSPQSILLLWSTWPRMPLCIDVCSAWGSPYMTCAFAWYKTMKTCPGFKMNGGSYTRSNTEVCLLGRPKGKALERSSAAIRQVIHEDGGEEACASCGGDGFTLEIPCMVEPVEGQHIGRKHAGATTILPCGPCGGSGFLRTSFPSAIEEPLSRHSRKPDEFYRRVKKLYAGRKVLELFSREPRRGFTVLGNEIDGTDIRESLERLASKRR